jgi:ankyrin repeat protein
MLVKQRTIVRIMATSIHDLCLEWISSRSAPDDDSCVVDGVARLCFLVRFALFFEQQRSLRQPLPTLAQLVFPPKRLQRFLRSCVVVASYRLVFASSSVYDDARKKMIWRNRIFARVMSGFVMKEEVRLQADAASRIARKSGILAAAASGDVVDVLSYLIAHANCMNERSDFQDTALHRAARHGHTQACQLLIAAKTDVNAADIDQYTALHRAARYGHTQACQLLIAAKTDLNAADIDQYTALHRAARYGHMEACQLLITARADVNAVDIDQYTALHHAACSGHMEACQLLKLLIAAKADLNATDNGQCTALHFAAGDGYMEACQLLIAAKADVDVTDCDGKTPLKHAIEQNELGVVALLASIGAAL